jgi:hypothetical protein
MNRIILKDAQDETIAIVSIGDSNKYPPVYYVPVSAKVEYSSMVGQLPDRTIIEKREFYPIAEGPNMLDGTDVIYKERLP